MIRLACVLALLATSLSAQNGAAIYQERCASCHEAPTGRVPPVSALRAMNFPLILRALESGVMKAQAEGLSSNERVAVTAYLAFPTPQPEPPPASAFCAGKPEPLANPAQSAHWSGWSPQPENTRFQDTAAAGITAADVPRLKLKWAFGLGQGTAARAQPSVAGGRLFVGDEMGAVYSLNAASGCMEWSFDASGPIRSAIVVGKAGKHAAAFFGGPKANVTALDANSGKLLWKVSVEEHFAAMITGTPLLQGRVLYVPVASSEEGLPGLPTYECCTFRGSVVALDAASGKQIWKTYTIAETPRPTKISKTKAQLYGPSGASIWSSPTLDEKRGSIYVATGDNYSDPATGTSDAVLALDRKTGKILWSKQLTSNDTYNNGCDSPFKTNCPDKGGPDFDFGQSPILVSLPNGRRALVIAQKSGVAHALDPDRQGEALWQTRVGMGGALGGSQWGSAADGDHMYVALSDLKIKGIALDKAAPQGYRLQLDPNQGGGLFALSLATGEKVWSAKPASCGDRQNCSPAQSAAVSVIPGAVFSGSVDGHLRAYSSASGEVIWDVDTASDYATVNGQKAHGGSLDGGGPVIAGGMLYVNSGYGQWGGLPGNVLLAFSVDGK
ncbi:MAG TPA: PQQ-binding-like beta-propeller repeat protein [Bryobacteraceae bacterium]|nr:PQQ-binding-like beta-propeller repeat protein [Bryobacteraceae bacterium]